MKTELFDYELPEELIAQRPCERRDDARLLVLGQTGIEHKSIREWPELVPEGALVVLNDSRVVHARLLGARRASGGRVEIFLLRRVAAEGEGDEEKWLALGKANRALPPGVQVDAGGIAIEVLERVDGMLLVRLRVSSGQSVADAVERFGRVPLPPYIHRQPDDLDRERYQTVFARVDGSVAAPTAGLHLTKSALARLSARGITVGSVTLHVGLGTFRPVTAEDLDQHEMHSEELVVSEEIAGQIHAARQRSAPVVAVGTTVVRALESARDTRHPGLVRPMSGATNLLVQPGYHFGVVDSMITNFHMPRSTLLALVSAFAGLERIRAAYSAAVRERYRFLSYGDAMWLSERGT